jgi:hypothetical protein
VAGAFQWAVNQAQTRFANPRDATLYISLLDHGTSSQTSDTFYLYDAENNCTKPGCTCIDPGQRSLTSTDLRGYIDYYQSNVGGPNPGDRPVVVVLHDFCYSGSFIDNIANAAVGERIAISSTPSNQVTGIGDGQSYSTGFYTALQQGWNILYAFTQARLSNIPHVPVLDDNNNGTFDQVINPQTDTCPSSKDGCVSLNFVPFKTRVPHSVPPGLMMARQGLMVRAAGFESTSTWDYEAPLPLNGANPQASPGKAFQIEVAVPTVWAARVGEITANVVPPGMDLSGATVV